MFQSRIIEMSKEQVSIDEGLYDSIWLKLKGSYNQVEFENERETRRIY